MKLNWQTIILNIRSNGISCASIARRVGCDPSAIRHLATAEVKEPKFSIGIEILNMHHDLCRDKHSMEHLALCAKKNLPRAE